MVTSTLQLLCNKVSATYAQLVTTKVTTHAPSSVPVVVLRALSWG